MPHEPRPNDKGDSVERAEGAEIVEITKPQAKPRAKRPAAPRKPRAPRAPRTPPVDPGPPPPLPPEFADPGDVVVPPRPPLPAPVPADADTIDSEDVTVAETTAEPEVLEASAEPDALEVHAEPEALEVPAEPEVLEASAEPDALEVNAEPEALEVPAEPDVPDAVAIEDLEEHVEVVEPDIDDEPAAADPESALAAVFAETEGDASVDPSSAALLLRGVTKSFGDTRAVEGIDLTVPAGTFYGLVGPNGAGKTTTLSMIAGLLRPDRGLIRVGGVDAAAKPQQAKRQLGVLPDRLRTFDRLTGRQLLYYYGVLRGLPSAVVESRTADLARAFDLTDALGRVVSDYSAGMVKKVMLAGAMIHSPRVLVLDEPFEAVDPVSSAVILDILSAYVAHGGTVILSSHGMDLVERVCTRVAVLVAGQVLAEGTVDDVRGELTLEQRFIELAGGLSDVEGLEWLHTFSD